MIYPWNLIGHEKQLLALENELAQDNLTHAYFFHGPKDTGKFTVALLFAKILLCPHNLCHQCQDCLWIESGVHPDFLLLKDEGQSLKIDDVRALVAKVSLTSQGKTRVVLIENIERMPIEAQNSFLKTLEEPPGKTIFLLTSSHPKAVLPTILSRVRPYEFSLVEDAEIKAALAEKAPTPGTLDEILQMAQGRPGLAIRLLKNPMEMAQYRDFYYKIEGFLKQNDLLSKFVFVEALEKEPSQLELFFDIFCLLLRKASHDLISQQINTLATHLGAEKIHELFEKLMEARYLISRNVNKKLVLENFFLETEQ